eukprot:scaffold1637_cov66-Phaeocystis_antarctica.AAC.4
MCVELTGGPPLPSLENNILNYRAPLRQHIATTAVYTQTRATHRGEHPRPPVARARARASQLPDSVEWAPRSTHTRPDLPPMSALVLSARRFTLP